MQNVQRFDLAQFLLKIVKTNDWSGLVGLVRAKAAEHDHVWYFCCYQRRCDRIADPFLVRAVVFAGKTWRNHGIHSARTGESLAEGLLVGEIGYERFGTFADNRLQALRTSADRANLLTIG